MQPPVLGQAFGLFEGGLEIFAMLDQLGAEGPHRGVLLAAIAMRLPENDRAEAGTFGRKGDALAVIVPRVAAMTPVMLGPLWRSASI